MNPHRRKLLVTLVAAVVVAGVVAFTGWRVLAKSSHRAGWESYARIEAGMTQAEVEAMLGVPPKSHDIGGRKFKITRVHFRGSSDSSDSSDWRYVVWASPKAQVWVFFRPDGTVGGKSIHEAVPASLWDYVKGWFGL